MKSNDKIPRDEMLLAEAIAAAKARGLGWCSGAPFLDKRLNECAPRNAVSCCALGALYFAGRIPLSTARSVSGRNMVHGLFSGQVFVGNDSALGLWSRARADLGESLGWAFRQAMTEGE